MSDQLSMFDDEPPGGFAAPKRQVAARPVRPPGHTIFFALRPPAEAANAIAAWGRRIVRELGVGGVPLEADRLHVSLFAIAGYDETFPEDQVAAALQAASLVRHEAFDVAFDRVANFAEANNAFVLKWRAAADAALELLRFRQALGIELADGGFHLTDRKMTPHMTLAYQGRDVTETVVDPIRWVARDLVLIDSHVGKHRHDVLGHWTLED